MTRPIVLQLPGWLGSGPEHWQSHWERRHGDVRVHQHDWECPRRGDWMARLDEVVQAQARPVVLVAHSLGCLLVAAWASVSLHTAGVRGALLVAPGDVEVEGGPVPPLPGWRPIVRQHLPFPSVLVGSRNDPYCTLARARDMARDWGADWVDLGNRGHINAESGLGDWPEGRQLIQPWLQAGVNPEIKSQEEEPHSW
jgi:predicted alpha/beta hydrolase family esterase